jgi:hypothetical protein
MTNDYEIRVIEASDLELRIGEAGQPSKLTGYAVVYNSLSADLGGFKERVLPGAFKTALSGGQDIRALVDHDPSKLLGRTSNNTLRLSEDDKGLRFEIDLPDTSYAKDAKALVDRKDVRGMSFGFTVPTGGQRLIKENNANIRELTNINLKEVTVTSIPAYGATSIESRVDPSIAAQFSEPTPRPNYEKRSKVIRTAQASM